MSLFLRRRAATPGGPLILALVVSTFLALPVSAVASTATAHPKGADASRAVTPQDTTDPVYSWNYSGFQVNRSGTSGFIGIRGYWNAPCVTDNPAPETYEYASWVGLGAGPRDPALEQAGIYLLPTGQYEMFWEYANFQQPLFDTSPADIVNCGDHIYAWVEVGSTYCANGGFYAHVENDTRGAHFGSTCLTESQGYGTQTGAWIDERPQFLTQNGGCGEYTVLDNFNYSQWSNVTVQSAGQTSWVNPNTYITTENIMRGWSSVSQAYITLANPTTSTISSTGGFRDNWVHHGDYCDSHDQGRVPSP